MISGRPNAVRVLLFRIGTDIVRAIALFIIIFEREFPAAGITRKIDEGLLRAVSDMFDGNIAHINRDIARKRILIARFESVLRHIQCGRADFAVRIEFFLADGIK